MMSRIAPACAAHELGLGRGRELEVHAPERALLRVEGDVGLRDERLQTVIGELVLAEGPREETPIVHAWLDVDDEGSGEPRFVKDQVRSISPVVAGPEACARITPDATGRADDRPLSDRAEGRPHRADDRPHVDATTMRDGRVTPRGGRDVSVRRESGVSAVERTRGEATTEGFGLRTAAFRSPGIVIAGLVHGAAVRRGDLGAGILTTVRAVVDTHCDLVRTGVVPAVARAPNRERGQKPGPT